VGDFEAEDPRRKRYRYNLIQPFVHLSLRQALRPPFATFMALRVQYTRVEPYPGSLLEAEEPPGMGGGLSVELGTGLIIDSRDNEVAPERGVFAEIAGRASPDVAGTGTAYAGPFLSLRAYHLLVPGDLGRRSPARIVVAWRVMGEWLFGEPPFYELTRWGGSVPLLGFGGYETLRGSPFGRYRGPGRAIANAEARIDVLQFRLLKQLMRVQIVPFLDLGIVWGSGALARDPEPTFPLRPAPGVGLHLVFAESFAARADFALAPDAVREADGTLTDEPNVGFYLMFDQTF
jgi:hypothetical protein